MNKISIAPMWLIIRSKHFSSLESPFFKQKKKKEKVTFCEVFF